MHAVLLEGPISKLGLCRGPVLALPNFGDHVREDIGFRKTVSAPARVTRCAPRSPGFGRLHKSTVGASRSSWAGYTSTEPIRLTRAGRQAPRQVVLGVCVCSVGGALVFPRRFTATEKKAWCIRTYLDVLCVLPFVMHVTAGTLHDGVPPCGCDSRKQKVVYFLPERREIDR